MDKRLNIWSHFLRYAFVLLAFIINLSLKAQLNITFTHQPNNFCNGCSYSGGSILINEVMIKPPSGDGSIYGSNNAQRGEWIELYNPDSCCPRDISCYFLGNNATDGGLDQDYPGGFELPPGTIVPPSGFVIVRGLNAPAVPSNLLVQNGGKTIEYVVGINQQYCMGGGERLWFPNAGNWFAFYDETGVPQDCIYWSDSLNFKHNTHPCDPPGGCILADSLPTFAQIPQYKKNYIASGLPVMGSSFKRYPDGGPWMVDIPFPPTYGDCNVQPCPQVNPCNGSATVSVTGGTSPYTYLWNDCRKQTGQTISGLCEGTYCVTVTDATGLTSTACVAVENLAPIVDIDPIPSLCQYGDSLKLTQGIPGGGAYVGDGIVDGYLYPTIAGPGDHMLHYFVNNGVGCYGEDSAVYTVWPAPVPIANAIPDSVCQGESVHLFASANMGSGSGYTYSWFDHDSLVASNPNVTIKDIRLSQAGNYLLMVKDSRDCSSAYPDTVRITVFPPPDINLVLPDTIYLCNGETYEIRLSEDDIVHCLWQNGDTNTYYLVEGEGIYSVKVDFSFCSVSDTVHFLPCTDFWIPNAFTPNRDNNNDVFLPKTSQNLKEYHLFIFDRWGQLLFTSDDIMKGWDGTHNDAMCKSDVYVYKVIWIPKEGGKQQRQGMVVLVR